MTPRLRSHRRAASILAVATLLGASALAVTAAPPQLRTADSGDLVARGGATFGDGTRDYVAVVGATSTGIGRGFAGPRVRSIDVPKREDGGRPRSASVLELVEGFAWMRLSPPGDPTDHGRDTPSAPSSAFGLPDGLPVADWMFDDDPATQLRSFFPLLTYPFFLTRRVAGGAAGTELIVLVADETDARCTVWVVYPGSADADADADPRATAEVAFHPWDDSRDAPAPTLRRIDVPAGSFVRLSMQQRRRGTGSDDPALWYAASPPATAPLDGLDAVADRSLIAAIRAAHGAATRAMRSRGESAPAGRRTFRGFALDGD